jgi:hypothetical protein
MEPSGSIKSWRFLGSLDCLKGPSAVGTLYPNAMHGCQLLYQYRQYVIFILL